MKLYLIAILFLSVSFGTAFGDVSLNSTSSGILISKITNFFGYDQIFLSEFDLIKIGSEPIQDIAFSSTDFNIKEQSPRTIHPLSIPRSSLNFIFSDVNSDGIVPTSITFSSDVRTKGIYTGKVSFESENAKKITVPVQISIKQDPFQLIWFTIFGVLLAIGLGIYNFFVEKNDEYRTQRSNKTIVNHINSHIFNINAIRDFIDNSTWESIKKIHDEKKRKIDARLKEFNALATDLEEIEWYENTVEKLTNMLILDKSKRVFSAKTHSLSPVGEDVCNPTFSDYWKKAKKDFGYPTNIVIRVTAAVVSVPLTLFGSEYFVGDPIVDSFIAIGVGFVVYKSQEIVKIFKKPDA